MKFTTEINAQDLIEQNLLVIGEAGSGKTAIVKKIVSEIAESGTPVVVVDKNQEFSDVASSNLLVTKNITDGLTLAGKDASTVLCVTSTEGLSDIHKHKILSRRNSIIEMQERDNFVFPNCFYVLLFKQVKDNISALTQRFLLTAEEQDFLLNCDIGEGIMILNKSGALDKVRFSFRN